MPAVPSSSRPADPNRRSILRWGAALTVLGATGSPGLAQEVAAPTPKRGRFKQVVANWCFTNASPQPWSLDKLLGQCRRLGLPGVELLRPEHWPLLKEHDLVCAATPSHGFVRGMNHTGHHPECLAALKKAIKATADAGFPNVMTFTGMADTSDHPAGGKVGAEEGMENCIKGYRTIAPYAADLGVAMVLEPLNSRVTEDMRGHPGYQGAHIDYCAEIVREVASPGLKLLFDVYHVQIMDGDLVRRIHQHKDLIGHVQIAGNPGRGPLGPGQEINYPAVMRAFAEIGYDGYVGHEWIPTGDPAKQLEEAVKICDV